MNLLDMNLDDFADLPEFLVPPPGTYNLLLKSMEIKTINEKTAIEINFSILSTVELVNAEDTAPTEGGAFSTLYIMDNEFGQGAFKAATANLKEALGVNTPRELIESSAGSEVVAVITNRKDKKDPSKVYIKLVDMFLA